jgi:hypothetical protein
VLIFLLLQVDQMICQTLFICRINKNNCVINWNLTLMHWWSMYNLVFNDFISSSLASTTSFSGATVFQLRITSWPQRSTTLRWRRTNNELMDLGARVYLPMTLDLSASQYHMRLKNFEATRGPGGLMFAFSDFCSKVLSFTSTFWTNVSDRDVEILSEGYEKKNFFPSPFIRRSHRLTCVTSKKATCGSHEG